MKDSTTLKKAKFEKLHEKEKQVLHNRTIVIYFSN